MGSGKKVVVLGGGPCGLSAAWSLAGAGYDVFVLEKDSEAGGLCRTSERDGYRFDLGGHRFISKDQSLVDRVCGLMGDELLVSERKSIIRFQGKNFSYPLEVKDIITKLNPFVSAACLASYLNARAKFKAGGAKEDTLEEWLINRYGRKLYEIFFKPYSTKLWGVTPDKISSDWASQRISLLNLSDVILRLLKLKKGRPRTYAIKYFYPKKGIGDLARHIGNEIERLGGQVRLNAEVRRVNVDDGKVTSVDYVSGGTEFNVKCDFVISTIPLPEMVKALTPSVPAEVKKAADRLQLRSLRFMNIMLDGIKDVSAYTWWYLQDGKYVATRLQEPKRRSSYSAPEGKTSVMLEIPCSVGDEVWTMDDKKLFERCISELSDLGLDLKDKVVGYFTTSVVYAYPVYTMDYRKNRDSLLDYLKGVGNMVSVGRQGLFDYIFMDDAMIMGLEAAEIAEGKKGQETIYDRTVSKELLEVKSVISDAGEE